MENLRLTSSHFFRSQSDGRRLVAAALLSVFFSMNWPPLASAKNSTLTTPPPEVSATATIPAGSVAPALANPALDLRASAPNQQEHSVFRRWWFWTAVGAAVAATVAVIVVSSRGHAPPTTDLGNQEFQP
jgi:hypothetical protein